MFALAVPAADDLVIATLNQEPNGMGDLGRCRAAYALVVQHGVQLLFRLPPSRQADGIWT